MALNTLYLLQYNNYYNRIVKKERTLDDYLAYAIESIAATNFNPADGVHTSHVLNITGDAIPDYIIEADNENNIISRWFVIEANRNLSKQYHARLRRDVCVDFYDELVSSEAFIERGTLEAGDPFIYNPEAVSFNQIKTSETLLKDESGCAWVVGYLDSGASDISATATFAPSVYETKATLADFTLSNGQKYNDVAVQSAAGGYHLVYESDVKLTVALCQLKDRVTRRGSSVPLLSSDFWASALANGSWAHPNNPTNSYNPIDFTTTSTGTDNLWEGNRGRIYTDNSEADFPKFGAAVNGRLNYSVIRPAIKEWMNSNVTLQGDAVKFIFMDGSTSQSQYDEMLALNGRYIKTSSDDKIYKISCYTYEETISSYQSDPQKQYRGRFITPTNSPTLFEACDNAVIQACVDAGVTYVQRTYDNVEAYEVEYQTSTRLYFKLLIVSEGTSCTLTLGGEDDRIHPVDSPYDIFCIPYNKDEPVTIYDGANIAYNITPDIAIRLATEFSRKYSGAGTLYDIQLLPYCPVRNYDILVDGHINIEAIKTDTKRFKEIDYGLGAVGCAFMVDHASFTANIPYSIVVNDVKVENQTDMYRLCSPNYSGLFEFNAAKNGGVEYINVDCTYIPHNPYIHININFKNLYGADFNDVRGLVCGGDFSLPTLTDAWETYQLQNKNYQAMFDRQIRSMDVEYKIARTEAIVGAVAGVFGGATSGASTGSQFSPAGAGIGAVLGGAASGVGAYFDLKHQQQRFEEQKSYATDMHNLQLGNVQALPTTLSRTTAYTFNNKIFPFVEYYTCTDAEKQAFKDKLKWEGMTIGRHDRVSNYIDGINKRFLMAQIKRLESVPDDYHVVNALSEELQKGVYI